LVVPPVESEKLKLYTEDDDPDCMKLKLMPLTTGAEVRL